jgi:hypothetical protein
MALMVAVSAFAMVSQLLTLALLLRVSAVALALFWAIPMAL